MEPAVFVACEVCTLESVIPENEFFCYCSSTGCCNRNSLLRPIVSDQKYVKTLCSHGYNVHRVEEITKSMNCCACGAFFNISDDVVEIRNKQHVYGCTKILTPEEQIRILKADLSSLKLDLSTQYTTLKKKSVELDEMKKKSADLTHQLELEVEAKKTTEQKIEELESKMNELEVELAKVEDRCETLKKEALNERKANVDEMRIRLLEEENQDLKNKLIDFEIQDKEAETLCEPGDERNTLWIFLINLVKYRAQHPDLIEWTNRDQYEFKLLDVPAVAELWGKKSGKEPMTEEMLLRALRFYDKKDVINTVAEPDNVYRFNKDSDGTVNGRAQKQDVPATCPEIIASLTKYLTPADFKSIESYREQSKGNTKERNPTEDAIMLFWLFLLRVVRDQDKHPHVVEWTNRNEFEFKLLDAEGVAQLWNEQKGSEHIKGEKILRALRHFEDKKMVKKIEGENGVYRFLHGSAVMENWYFRSVDVVGDYKDKKISLEGIFEKKESMAVARENKYFAKMLFKEGKAILEKERMDLEALIAQLASDLKLSF